MKKIMLATALLLAFSANAQTSQPCGSRSKGSLRVSKNYDNLLNESAAKTSVSVKSDSKAKGTK